MIPDGTTERARGSVTSAAAAGAEAAHRAEREALMALASVVEPADERVVASVARWGAISVLERIRSGELAHPRLEGARARLSRIDRHVDERGSLDAQAAMCGARIITALDREWPTQLSALGSACPLALWVSGAADLRLLALRSLSIVGARACTAYGEEVARSWAAELAGEGWTVVSGAAFGIDAAAHRGALAAEGATIAILAGGVDMPYPRAHAPLLEAIVDNGLIVSESPPGEPVRRHRFLTRNRLIAALARAVVVVEAATRSGASATARDAARLRRPVLAVPGPVTSPASTGCHRMIQEGEALLAGDVEDVRVALDLTASGPPPHVDRGPGAREERDRLADRERLVLDAMPVRRAVGLDGLVDAAGLGAGDVLAAVGVLVSRGWLEEVPGGWRLIRT